MVEDDQVQRRCFEAKYLVTETAMSAVRDCMRRHLEPESFSSVWTRGLYSVHSCYLDSDELTTHRAAVGGARNRFVLRLRCYDDQPGTPVFFEVKAHTDTCIVRQRCAVRRTSVPRLLTGELPSSDDMLSCEPGQLVALQKFILLMQQVCARPKVHICYFREAWVSSNDDSIRVTLDRQIRAEPWFNCEPATVMRRSVRLFPGFVVLKVKYRDQVPRWCQDMVKAHHLMPTVSAKYSVGVTALGEHALRDSGQAVSALNPVYTSDMEGMSLLATDWIGNQGL